MMSLMTKEMRMLKRKDRKTIVGKPLILPIKPHIIQPFDPTEAVSITVEFMSKKEFKRRFMND